MSFQKWLGEATTATYYYHTGVLGSVMAISNAAGALVESYLYGPFGALLSVTDKNGAAIPEQNRKGNPIGAFGGWIVEEKMDMSWYKELFFDTENGRVLNKQARRGGMVPAPAPGWKEGISQIIGGGVGGSIAGINKLMPRVPVPVTLGVTFWEAAVVLAILGTYTLYRYFSKSKKEKEFSNKELKQQTQASADKLNAKSKLTDKITEQARGGIDDTPNPYAPKKSSPSPLSTYLSGGYKTAPACCTFKYSIFDGSKYVSYYVGVNILYPKEYIDENKACEALAATVSYYVPTGKLYRKGPMKTLETTISYKGADRGRCLGGCYNTDNEALPKEVYNDVGEFSVALGKLTNIKFNSTNIKAFGRLEFAKELVSQFGTK